LTSKAYRRAESQWLGLSRPYVIIFSTVTLDGRLASKEGYSRLSCEFDKVRQHRLRSEVDAVMVGGGTVRKDDPLLTVRLVKAKRNPNKGDSEREPRPEPRPQGVRHAAAHDRLFGL